MDIIEFEKCFPDNLVPVLERYAEAFSVPRQGLVTLIFHLASIYSPRVYVSSPGGGRIDPLIEYFFNQGPSGINKTGIFNILQPLVNKINDVFRGLHMKTDILFDKGFQICLSELPVLDSTATPAAAIQKQSKHRNLMREDDEFVTLARALSNGTSGGGMESGVQKQLQVFNGPTEMVNELKSAIEISYVPRHNIYFNIQPDICAADLGPESSLFSLGYTSRFLGLNLTPNFEPGKVREPLQSDEQSLAAFVVAIAVRGGIITSGEWHDCENPQAIEDAFRGSELLDLTAEENVQLSYRKKRFLPLRFGKLAVESVEMCEHVSILNGRNAAERARAQMTGKQVAGRYEATVQVYPGADSGKGPLLPLGFAQAGITDMRMLHTETGSNSEDLLNLNLLKCERRLLESKDPRVKIIDGKGGTHLLRVAGLRHVVEVACRDVGSLLGGAAICSLDALKDFAISVAQKSESEALTQQSAADAVFGSAVDDDDDVACISVGVGTSMESRIPFSSVEFIQPSVIYSASYTFELFRETMIGIATGAKQSSLTSKAKNAASGFHPESSNDLSHNDALLTSGHPNRLTEIIASLVSKRFIVANVTQVLNIRFRKVKKGDRQGESEMDQLRCIQHTGLFDLSVHHGNPIVILVHKYDLNGASADVLEDFARKLIYFSITLDEYRASVFQDSFDIDIASLAPILTSKIPHGLKPFNGQLISSGQKHSELISPMSTQIVGLDEDGGVEKKSKAEELKEE